MKRKSRTQLRPMIPRAPHEFVLFAHGCTNNYLYLRGAVHAGLSALLPQKLPLPGGTCTVAVTSTGTGGTSI